MLEFTFTVLMNCETGGLDIKCAKVKKLRSSVQFSFILKSFNIQNSNDNIWEEFPKGGVLSIDKVIEGESTP